MTQVIKLTWFDSKSHQAADGSGRGVLDRDLLVLQDAIPPLRVKFCFINNVSYTMQHWSNHAVGSACHPNGIGRAPENIILMHSKAYLAVM